MVLARPLDHLTWNDPTYIYCRVPEGRGLHQSARPLSRDETQAENPLVLIKVVYSYLLT